MLKLQNIKNLFFNRISNNKLVNIIVSFFVFVQSYFCKRNRKKNSLLTSKTKRTIIATIKNKQIQVVLSISFVLFIAGDAGTCPVPSFFIVNFFNTS